jgi:serine/threonine protein kinase
VKKGEFSFPPGLPDDISDLIRRILVVDPDQRITLRNIKCHPIPHVTFSIPVDHASLSADVIAVLAAIGYSDEEELRGELSSPALTMAKVFVALLSDTVDLEMLPWDLSENLFSETWRAVDYVLSGAAITGSPEIAQGRLAGSASIGSISSSVSRPGWYVDPTPVSVVREVHEIVLEDCEIWNLMAIAQDAARDCGRQFFHPDHFTLYVRSRDATFYGSVKATSVTRDSIKMQFALHKGDAPQFTDFKDRLVQILQD